MSLTEKIINLTNRGFTVTFDRPEFFAVGFYVGLAYGKIMDEHLIDSIELNAAIDKEQLIIMHLDMLATEIIDRIKQRGK